MTPVSRSISDTELTVLKTLWRLGKGAVRDLLADLERQGFSWAYTTVQTLLNRLEQKGYVSSEKVGRAYEFRVVVTRDGDEVATLTPERRAYPVEGDTTTEAAIHTTWFADIYAVVGDGDPESGWTVRLYHNPLVPWIWVGAVIMVLGGLVSLSDRRHRVGVPERRRRPSGAAAPVPAE